MLIDHEHRYDQFAHPAIGTVLLVEDDGLLAMALEESVRILGAAEVHCCADVDSATEVARSATIDCALLDVMARDQTTYEVWSDHSLSMVCGNDGFS
jgi:DNA-binding response OmpR family regulator